MTSDVKIRRGQRFVHKRLLKSDYRTPQVCEITRVVRGRPAGNTGLAWATVYYGQVDEDTGEKPRKACSYCDVDYFLTHVLKEWI